MGSDTRQQGGQFIPAVLNNDVDPFASEKGFAFHARPEQIDLGVLRQFFDRLQQQCLPFAFLYSSRDHQPQFSIHPVPGQHLDRFLKGGKAMWNDIDVEIGPGRVQFT